MIAIKIEKDVPIPMRDGLKLAANIFRPDKPGEFPQPIIRQRHGRYIG